MKKERKNKEIKKKKTPSKFTYLWSFESEEILCLVIQMVTGVVISMCYTGRGLAFGSIEYKSREVYTRKFLWVLSIINNYTSLIKGKGW